MAAACLSTVRKIQREGFDFDLIDAHYYYPDGVAAVLLGQWLNKPVVVTARGTDLNLIPQYWLPRKMIQWAAVHAKASIGVSRALTVWVAFVTFWLVTRPMPISIVPPESRVQVIETVLFGGKSAMA